MKKMKWGRLAALSLTCIIGLTACGGGGSSAPSAGGESQPAASGSSGNSQPAASAEVPSTLRFYAAPQTGSWYPLAVAITEAMKKELPVLKQVSIEPGGGVANVVALEAGQGELGFSQAMPLADGVAGNPPFKNKAENVQYVMSLFPHVTQIVVLKGSGIESIEDIKGKTINVGQRGLLTEDIASRIVKAYGMTYQDMKSVQNLSFADAVEQMKDGRIDVMFWTVPLPFAVLNDLSQSKDMDLLSIPDDKIEELTKQNPGLVRTTIPAGVYKGLDHEVQTIQSPLVVIANKNASEQLVYEMTKTIYNGLEDLKKIDPALKDIEAKDLPIDIGVPYHPGAERFFKEQGLLK